MKPARSDGETVEKWRTKSAEKCGLKTARRRKAFEKCGEGIPREVTDKVRREEQVKPARRVGGADGMVSKYLNNNYFSTTSRCKTTLPVA